MERQDYELIMDAIRNSNKSEYTSKIFEKRNGQLAYHLSDQRSNIIDFIQFNASCSVLELGAEGGAITSELIKRVKSIDAIEEDEQLFEILKTRMDGVRGVRCIKENIREYMNSQSNSYDVVLLIGTLEKANLYYKEENPYLQMIDEAWSLLNDNGLLVIAVDNKFGLRNWAGCREKYSQYFFESIEGYPHHEGAKMISRKELLMALDGSEVKRYYMYYPYPDYVFTSSIYSDDCLPKRGELKANGCNVFSNRMLLFNDSAAFDELIDEGLFKEFSNSYLVIGKKGMTNV